MILTGIPGWQGVMGWQRSQGLAHGFLLCQFLCLELFVVVGLLDTERIVEIVVVDGQPYGRELLHDVYIPSYRYERGFFYIEIMIVALIWEINSLKSHLIQYYVK